MDSIENRVRCLEDERAIQKLIYTYCFAVDNKRQELWVDIFTEDAVLMFKPQPGILPADSAIGKAIARPIIGRKQLAEWFEKLPQSPDPPTKHVTVNTIITLHGDEATAYTNLIHFMDRGGSPVLLSTGRYNDTFRRCSDGQWRVAERIAHMDSMRQEPA
jgi:ketosteroid isomerase-like protein